MSSIFISHKNIPHDNDWAARILVWIKDQKGIDGFLDFNVQQGLQAGGNWEQEIYAAMNRAQTVIALMSPEWLASDWCMSEARMAKLRGLQLIPALIGECTNPFPEIQHIDFTGDEGRAFEQLREALKTTHKLPSRPYPGLAAFQQDDAAIFFGREDETRDLINQLNSLFNGRPETARLLLVLGASGSGKSSLVRAGVLPMFNAEARQIALEPIIPRGNPLKELGRVLDTTFDGLAPQAIAEHIIATLKKTDPRFRSAVITVDQAEELLRGDNSAFFSVARCLLERGEGDIVMLATMRSDFLNEFQQRKLIGAGSELDYETFTVDPMPDERLSNIIRKPAKLYGVDYEDELIDQIRSDHGGPDALPLLAFFLSEFWRPDYIKDGILQLAEYQNFGGISQALNKTVERSLMACRKLDPTAYGDDRRLLDDLKESFLGSLVSINSISGQPIRNRVSASAMSAQQTALLAPFEQQRLLIVRDNEWEVVHEALFRQWADLRQWIESAREDLIAIDRVNTAAKQWQEGGCSALDLIHTGDRLSDVIKLSRSERYRARCRPDDSAYLDACAQKDRDELEKERKARERERSLREQAEQESARAQAGEKRATLFTIIGFAIALLAAAAGGLAAWQWGIAEKAVVRSVQNESRALAELAETAYNDHQNIDAIKLALASWPRDSDDPRLKLKVAMRALGRAQRSKRQVIDPLRHEGSVYGAVFNQAETRILTRSGDGTAQLWDAESGQALFEQPLRHEDAVDGAVFNQAETRILTWSGDGTAQLWDAESGQALFEQPLRHGNRVNDAVFNQAETRILTRSYDGTAQLWDAESGQALFEQPLRHEGSVDGAVFNQAETRILTWSGDGTAQLWDAESGQALFEQPLRHEDAVDGAVFNQSETRILTWSGDGTAQLWDAESGQALFEQPLRHEDAVDGAVFNQSETRILTWSGDGTAQLWDAESGQALFEQPLRHEDAVDGAVFNQSETRILTWSDDGTAQLWDAESGQALFEQPLRHEEFVYGAVFNQAETRILTWSLDDTARLWDAESGQALFEQPLRHGNRVNGAVFNQAETRILTWSGDGTAQLWDAESGQALFEQPLRHEEFVYGAVFNQAETRILTWSLDDTARLWDAESGQALFEQPLRHEGSVDGAVFNRPRPASSPGQAMARRSCGTPRAVKRCSSNPYAMRMLSTARCSTRPRPASSPGQTMARRSCGTPRAVKRCSSNPFAMRVLSTARCSTRPRPASSPGHTMARRSCGTPRAVKRCSSNPCAMRSLSTARCSTRPRPASSPGHTMARRSCGTPRAVKRCSSNPCAMRSLSTARCSTRPRPASSPGQAMARRSCGTPRAVKRCSSNPYAMRMLSTARCSTSPRPASSPGQAMARRSCGTPRAVKRCSSNPCAMGIGSTTRCSTSPRPASSPGQAMARRSCGTLRAVKRCSSNPYAMRSLSTARCSTRPKPASSPGQAMARRSCGTPRAVKRCSSNPYAIRCWS